MSIGLWLGRSRVRPSQATPLPELDSTLQRDRGRSFRVAEDRRVAVSLLSNLLSDSTVLKGPARGASDEPHRGLGARDCQFGAAILPPVRGSGGGGRCMALAFAESHFPSVRHWVSLAARVARRPRQQHSVRCANGPRATSSRSRDRIPPGGPMAQELRLRRFDEGHHPLAIVPAVAPLRRVPTVASVQWPVWPWSGPGHTSRPRSPHHIPGRRWAKFSVARPPR